MSAVVKPTSASHALARKCSKKPREAQEEGGQRQAPKEENGSKRDNKKPSPEAVAPSVGRRTPPKTARSLKTA
eukprot:3120778-Alexandrium_andersonii.AAC.1